MYAHCHVVVVSNNLEISVPSHTFIMQKNFNLIALKEGFKPQNLVISNCYYSAMETLVSRHPQDVK